VGVDLHMVDKVGTNLGQAYMTHGGSMLPICHSMHRKLFRIDGYIYIPIEFISDQRVRDRGSTTLMLRFTLYTTRLGERKQCQALYSVWNGRRGMVREVQLFVSLQLRNTKSAAIAHPTFTYVGLHVIMWSAKCSYTH